MKRSESITALAKALASAQGAIKNAAKDTDNPYFKSKYADLASIRDVVREPFAANGLSCPQFISTADGGRFQGTAVDENGKEVATDDFLTIVTVETMLLHESGEFMSTSLDLRIWNADPQKIGSASTYGRRYGLQSVAGVAAEADDDGNAASGRPQTPQQRQEPRRAPQVPQQQAQRSQYSQAAQGGERPLAGAQSAPSAGAPRTAATGAHASETTGATSAPATSASTGNPVTEEQKVKMRELYAKLGIENAAGANQLVGDLMQCSLKEINNFDKAKMLIAKLTNKVATSGGSNG